MAFQLARRFAQLTMVDDVSTVAGYAQSSDEATTHQQYKYAVENSFCKDFSFSCARELPASDETISLDNVCRELILLHPGHAIS